MLFAPAIGATTPPTTPDNIVPRADVVARLSSALGRVAAVSAPGGYGKTSQVAALARSDGRPVAWLELDSSENDPQLLVEHLIAALVDVTDISTAGLPQGPMSTAQFETLTAPKFGNVVRQCTRPFILVLDDLHRLDRGAALEAVASVARNVPSNSTVVLIGRDAPRASLMTLAINPGLVEIGVSELALDAAATASLLDSIGVSLDEDDLQELVDHTEGWPLGVRFAGFALQRARELGGPVAVGTVLADRAVVDYMSEEWLQRLPADDVDFLRRVSGLGWFSGALCDHALDRSDSGAVLERLSASPLIVTPLDRRGGSYRLHQLLAEMLDHGFECLDRQSRRIVAIRASEWFEQTGDIDRAILHSLRGDDVARAVRLVGDHGAEFHALGRHHSVDRWLAALPREVVLSNPRLCLVAAFTAVAVGDADAGLIWLKFGEQAAKTGSCPDPALALQMLALRSLLSTSDLEAALADAELAYAGLPPGLWHASACFASGVLHFVLGDDEAAAVVLAEGATEARLVGAVTIEAQCLGNLALVCAAQGDWARARPHARAARRLLRDHDLEHMPTLVTVTAVSAWAEAMAGFPEVARADVLLTRRNLAYLDKVAMWANVNARVATAHASLLLGDRVATKMLIDETKTALEATSLRGRVAELIADANLHLDASRVALPVGPSSLTTAELRLLHYLPTNMSLAEIGCRLFVSRNTVKSHAAAVYRKLGASSRSDAIALARASGLLPDA